MPGSHLKPINLLRIVTQKWGTAKQRPCFHHLISEIVEIVESIFPLYVSFMVA